MKRMQIVFTDEARSVVETMHNQATENFDSGSISTSDVVNVLDLHNPSRETAGIFPIKGKGQN